MTTPGIGKRVFVPRPPEKGSFPLDHDGDCRKLVSKYLKCLHEKQLDSSECRDVAKDYLQCRMDNNLMAKESMEDLGFSETKEESTTNQKQTKPTT